MVITHKNFLLLSLLSCLLIGRCLFAEEDAEQLRYTFGFKADYDERLHALVVTDVKEDSPAEKADLRVGDYIIEIDYSRKVFTFLYNATRNANEGKRRTFTILRGRRRMEIDIYPEETDDVA